MILAEGCKEAFDCGSSSFTPVTQDVILLIAVAAVVVVLVWMFLRE
jgi:hypothetical protein